ncbi:hypothetical protein Slin14017_G110530 [Septoria linicola]|nr:hypothetical protein Slin14017_G110530 [Septoria linicola]
MDFVPRDDTHLPHQTTIHKPQAASSPFRSDEPSDEVIPQSPGNRDSHEKHGTPPPGALDTDHNPKVPVLVSQETAGKLLDVEKEAASTLASLPQAQIKSLTQLPNENASDAFIFRPLQSSAEHFVVNQTTVSAPLKRSNSDGRITFRGCQIGPKAEEILPCVDQLSGPIISPPHQQGYIDLTQESAPKVKAGDALVRSQVSGSTQKQQAFSTLRDPHGPRGKFPYCQRVGFAHRDVSHPERARRTTPSATSKAQQAQGREAATQDYQAAVSALMSLRQSHANPPRNVARTIATQHVSQQPTTSSLPQIILAGQHHSIRRPQRIRYHPKSKAAQYIRAQMQQHRQIANASRRRLQRTLPKPTSSVHDRRVYRQGPYYASLPTAFGALYLARGCSDDSTTTSPYQNAGNAEADAIDLTQDDPLPGDLSSAVRNFPSSSCRKLQDEMNKWQTGHFAKWKTHGVVSSDSGHGLADSLPGLVLDREDGMDEEYEESVQEVLKVED